MRRKSHETSFHVTNILLNNLTYAFLHLQSFIEHSTRSLPEQSCGMSDFLLDIIDKFNGTTRDWLHFICVWLCKYQQAYYFEGTCTWIYRFNYLHYTNRWVLYFILTFLKQRWPRGYCDHNYQYTNHTHTRVFIITSECQMGVIHNNGFPGPHWSLRGYNFQHSISWINGYWETTVSTVVKHITGHRGQFA